jgi:trk system potassium uptake protein TrkA
VYVVIVGAGRIGHNLAKMLIEAGNEVTLVEKDQRRVREVGDLDAHVLHGSGTNPAVLRSINVHDAGAIVAVTGDEAVNLASCLVAKRLSAASKRDSPFTTIARISDVDLESPFYELGIDRVISPEKAASEYISSLIRSPGVVDVTSIGKGQGEVLELHLDERSPVIGRTLAETSAMGDMSRSIVIAVVEDDELIIAHGDTTLKAGMTVYLFSIIEESKKARRLFLGSGRS